MKKQKYEKLDPYAAKYLVLIISARTKVEEKITAVIDKIYQDGFEDGANSQLKEKL